MTHVSDRRATTRSAVLSKTSLYSVVIAVAFLVIGTVLVFHVQLFSGLRFMQPDDTDPRLVNYILERNHQWFLGQRPDEDFWSPPFCYPWQDLGTHTESMLGLQPFFSPWRVAGLTTETAYQLCSMGLLMACFLSAFLLFSRGCRFGALPAAAGAFIFAFAGPRAAQIGHIQLFAHYATPLAVLGLVQEYRLGRFDSRRWQWIFLFCASTVIQFYGSIYLTWFFVVFLGFALIVALLWNETRSVLSHSLRTKGQIWIGGIVLSVLASLPLLIPYLAASKRLPGSTFADVFPLLPQPESFLYQGYGSWVGRFLGVHSWPPIATLQYMWEHAMSPGYVTTLMAIIGLWVRRREPLARICLCVASVVLLLVMRWPGGFTLWRWVFEVLPGANAIRAMTRISVPILLIVGYGVAASLSLITRKWGTLPAALLAGLMAFEQGQTQLKFDRLVPAARSQAIAGIIPDGCQTFFYTGTIDGDQSIMRNQIDAMWAGLYTSVPTVNGYTGYLPPGWWETVAGAMGESPSTDALAILTQGVADRGGAASSLSWVRVSFQGTTVADSEVRTIPVP